MSIDWQVVIFIASILTAIGVIVGTAKKWGSALAKLIVHIGFKQLTGEELADNPAMRAGHDARQEIMQKLDTIQGAINEDTLLTLKTELKSLYNDYPELTDTIEQTYARYRALGGNSYIKSLHEAWQEKYEKKDIDEHLNKGA